MSRLAALVSLGLVSTMVSSAGLRVAVATAQVVRAYEATVVYVADGDTIDVRIGDHVERVRYIGVDAPEIGHGARGGRPARRGAPGGVAAARVNASLVAGHTVRLELDAEERDRYGRLLAYVWVGERMANAELVGRGYARTMPIPPNLRYASRLAALEADARATHRGLWGAGLFEAKSPSDSEHFYVAPDARIALVSNVRARVPERHRPRVRALGQHRHPPDALRAQASLRLAHQRARHAAAPPVR
jgi:micrococcal nuclease